MAIRVAFLGPEGTYAEKAAVALAELEKIPKPDFIPCKGLRSVIEHLAKNLCEAAVVPVENSVEGGVTATLDSLWAHPELSIRRAVVLPIKHSLFSSGNLNEVSEVLSHPQALAQCNEWLEKNLPNALQLPTSSTAEAVKMVYGSRFRAAISSKTAGNTAGLKELAFPINDIAGNRTRFLLLKKEDIKQKGDIASFAFSLKTNSPGALLKALSCIANYGLNMSRIESRPSKRELGEYIFFVDIEVPGNQVKNQELLMDSLLPYCEHFVNFGLYPSSEIQEVNSINF